jgi:hypothetical protein
VPTKVEVTLDTEGLAAVLNSAAVQSMVTEAANRVAQATGVPARVYGYTTDRKAAAVTVAAEAQARDGVLTSAASSLGLRVVPKGDA